MIVCNNCGTPIAPGERTCAECGNENAAPAQPQISANDVVVDRSFTTPRSSSSRTFNTVTAVIGAIIFLTIGAIGARFLLSRDRSNQMQSSTMTPSPPNTSSRLPEPGSTPFAKTSPSPKQPAPAPNDTQAVNEVIDTLNGWAAATRARDLDSHMSYYAETLDTYFLKHAVSSSYVRGSKSPAFTRYHTLDVQIRNIQVNPDPSGMRATAIFDKTYRFEGGKVLSGSVQQLVWLSKASGRWQITGEKDLRVYFTNK